MPKIIGSFPISEAKQHLDYDDINSHVQISTRQGLKHVRTRTMRRDVPSFGALFCPIWHPTKLFDVCFSLSPLFLTTLLTTQCFAFFISSVIIELCIIYIYIMYNNIMVGELYTIYIYI